MLTTRLHRGFVTIRILVIGLYLILSAPALADTLHETVRNADIARITALLEAGADINARDKVGNTSLHVAAHRGHVDAISVLLDAGADPNLQDEAGNLPIGLIKEDSSLYKSTAWWRLNDARQY